MLGEQLTRWTIWIALLCYFNRLALGLICANGSELPGRREAAARWFWTIGCLALWLHVACAFQFYHDWSHAAAYEETARETAAITGLDWGGGLWFNYLLLALWTADAAWWWLAPASYRGRSRLVEWLWQGYFGMMAFCATVVFEEGFVRVMGVGMAVALVVAFLVLHAREKGNAP